MAFWIFQHIHCRLCCIWGFGSLLRIKFCVHFSFVVMIICRPWSWVMTIIWMKLTALVCSFLHIKRWVNQFMKISIFLFLALLLVVVLVKTMDALGCMWDVVAVELVRAGTIGNFAFGCWALVYWTKSSDHIPSTIAPSKLSFPCIHVFKLHFVLQWSCSESSSCCVPFSLPLYLSDLESLQPFHQVTSQLLYSGWVM